MLQNSVLFPHCAVASHARVNRKTSDVNDAELPHLEVVSRYMITIVTGGLQ